MSSLFFMVILDAVVVFAARVRQAPSIVVVASDGVWDSMTQESVSKLVSGSGCRARRWIVFPNALELLQRRLRA